MRISDWSSDVCSSDLALFDRRDIFARNVAALDLVQEGDARATFAGSDADLDAAELARAARLLLVGIVDIDGLRERFAVRHLRRADVRFDLELALHAIDEDVEGKLAHALDENGSAECRERVGQYG